MKKVNVQSKLRLFGFEELSSFDWLIDKVSDLTAAGDSQNSLCGGVQGGGEDDTGGYPRGAQTRTALQITEVQIAILSDQEEQTNIWGNLINIKINLIYRHIVISV